MAQSVKHLSLDLSSGLDLTVVSSSPALGPALGMKPTLKKKKRKKEKVVSEVDSPVEASTSLFIGC